jgi:hypothetical protein
MHANWRAHRIRRQPRRRLQRGLSAARSTSMLCEKKAMRASPQSSTTITA